MVEGVNQNEHGCTGDIRVKVCGVRSVDGDKKVE